MTQLYPKAVKPYVESKVGWPLPLPPRAKKMPPTGYTGGEGRVPSEADFSVWIADNPDGNVALRLERDVVGFDVDHYGKKTGGDALDILIEHHGLLPETWRSSSREGNDVSGIRFYRCPADVLDHAGNEVGPGVEIIRYGHRYAVVAPSIHPEGGTYRWYSPDGRHTVPTLDDLPWLPDEWVKHLSANGHCTCQGGTGTLTESGSGIEIYHPTFDSPEHVLSKTRQRIDNGSSAHDSTTAAVFALERFSEQKRPGAREALADLEQMFMREVTKPEREGNARRTEKAAALEWQSMVKTARKKIENDPSSYRYEAQSDDPPTEIPTGELPSHLRLYEQGDLGGFIPPISDRIIQGRIGDWLTLVEPETEASLEALGAGILAGLGAWLGPHVGLNVGRLRHRTNLFVAVVGPSGRARKGTADGEVRTFLNRIDSSFVAMNVASGFGSGEAIVSRLKDPVWDETGDKIISGTLDQRLLVNEGELAQVFRVMSRQGSILSDVLRNGFDNRPLENITKATGTIRASNACVSMAGGITPDELVTLFSEVSGTNGVGGRILWIWSNPHKLLPQGGQLVELEDLARSILQRGATITYSYSDQAAQWWNDHYEDLRNTPGLHPTIHAMTNRTTDHVQRIALIYAATEGTDGYVDVRHLEAGEAWAKHSHSVVQSILGGLVRDGLAGRILASLRRHPGVPVDRREVYDLLNRNSTGAEINGAIQSLSSSGLAYQYKGTSTGGRPPTLLVATTPRIKEVPK